MNYPYTRYAYEKVQNGEFTSIYGDKLTKIYKFKKDDPELFESDVPETTRILLDMYPDSDTPANDIRTFTFDIEVEMESGLPDTREAENEITAIGFHDSKTQQYWVLVMDKEGKMVQQQTERAIVIPFTSEREMLLKFLLIYQEIQPDVITGWNVDHFDIPYLYNRLKRLLGDKHAKRLSPIGEAFYSPYRERFFFAGVSVMDYITLYRNFNFGELANYRLDTVGRKEVNMGKIEYEGSLDDLFNTDIDKFIEYNLVDVEIVVKLDEKLQFQELARSICTVGHVPYEDFVYSSKYLEGALLSYLRRHNLVAPNKPADRREKMKALKENKENKFSGAYVKAPIVGKYEWIYDLDLTSLYPSIIMTLNISPETKIVKLGNFDTVRYSNDPTAVFKFGEDDITQPNLQRYIKDNNLSISSNGVIYKNDHVGCIPGILDMWFKLRMEYKGKMVQYGKEGNDELYAFYDKRQHVQKILLNSFYGVLGLPAFRFYDVENAEAVTTSGQFVIKNTAKMASLKMNAELGGAPLVITMEDNSTRTYYPFTPVSVMRNNGIEVIRANELVETDDIVEEVT